MLTIYQGPYATTRFSSSIREIGQAIGLKSSSSVHGYLVRLETKGSSEGTRLNREQLCVRSSAKEHVHVPVVGKVTADNHTSR